MTDTCPLTRNSIEIIIIQIEGQGEQMVNSKTAKLQLIISMVLFGTIGLFVRYLTLPSSLIALCRAWIGCVFLLLVLAVQRKRFCRKAVLDNLIWLLLSGCFLGFNWIALFEAYRYTSVAIGTVCYYTAPILVILCAPWLLKESLSVKKTACAVAAVIGVGLLSFQSPQELASPGYSTGIFLGLLAAALYACVILCNKRIKGIDAMDKTVIQLFISGIMMLPYCFMTVDFCDVSMDPFQLIILLTVGIVHTGVTYLMYFGAMENVSGQSVAVISYIDPVVAVLLSVFVLKEQLSAAAWVGAAMILASALLSEINWKEKQLHD